MSIELIDLIRDEKEAIEGYREFLKTHSVNQSVHDVIIKIAGQEQTHIKLLLKLRKYSYS